MKKIGETTVIVKDRNGAIRQTVVAPVYEESYGCRMEFPEEITLRDGESYEVTPPIDSFSSGPRITSSATFR